MFLIIGAFVVVSTVATASFIAAFSPADEEIASASEDGGQVDKNKKKNKKQSTLANIDDFKLWLGNYKGVSSAEKNIAYGMMEQNSTKAYTYFSEACAQGDERGCFQLALNEVSTQKPEGLDRLHDLSISGKNKEVAQKSGQLLGAYILDFAPKNKSAVAQSLEAVLPHAVSGDATSQFIAANLFLANGIFNEADMMLTKACNNPEASDRIISFCREGQNVEAIDENGIVIVATKNEVGTCSNQ